MNDTQTARLTRIADQLRSLAHEIEEVEVEQSALWDSLPENQRGMSMADIGIEIELTELRTAKNAVTDAAESLEVLLLP